MAFDGIKLVARSDIMADQAGDHERRAVPFWRRRYTAGCDKNCTSGGGKFTTGMSSKAFHGSPRGRRQGYFNGAGPNQRAGFIRL